MLKRSRLNWVRLAYISGTLGYRRRDSAKLGLYHAAVVIADSLGIRLRPLVVRLAPEGHEVVVSADKAEFAVMHSVLLHDEYRSWGDPEVIFDLGANIGFATLFFARRHPRARIVAVEADPRTYSRLVRNVRTLSNVITLNRAISAQDGTATFFSSSQNSISSSLTRTHPDDTTSEVHASTLQTLMKDVGVDHIDLLKMDIEGAEFDVLASSPLDKVSAIEAEIHLDHGDEATVRRLLSGFDVSLYPLVQPNLLMAEAHRGASP
jgi:FkbM family methyltransferase